MAKLKTEDIEHIAKLARIQLSQEEKQKYSVQITDILSFVEKLDQIKTDGVAETSQVTGLENVFRSDIADEKTHVDSDKLINREKLLANAPAQKDGYLKVKAILE